MEITRLIGFAVISCSCHVVLLLRSRRRNFFTKSNLGVVSGYVAVQAFNELTPLYNEHITAYILIFTLSFFISFMKTPYNRDIHCLRTIWCVEDVGCYHSCGPLKLQHILHISFQIFLLLSC